HASGCCQFVQHRQGEQRGLSVIGVGESGGRLCQLNVDKCVITRSQRPEKLDSANEIEILRFEQVRCIGGNQPDRSGNAGSQLFVSTRIQDRYQGQECCPWLLFDERTDSPFFF